MDCAGFRLQGLLGREISWPGKCAGVAEWGAERLGLPLGGPEKWRWDGLDSQSFQGLL